MWHFVSQTPHSDHGKSSNIIKEVSDNESIQILDCKIFFQLTTLCFHIFSKPFFSLKRTIFARYIWSCHFLENTWVVLPLIQDKMLISLAWRKESVVTWCLLPFQPPSQHPQLMLCNPSPQPAMLLGFLTCLPSHLFLSLFGVILCQPYHTWKMSVGVKIRDSGARSFVTYYDLFLFQFSHSFVSVW